MPSAERITAERSAPGRTAALAFVSALIDEIVTERVDGARLAAFVRPANLPAAPSAAWYARLATALGPDGALGEGLRTSTGPVGVQDGPDYTRVVLGGAPLLTIVLTQQADGVWIDAIDRTSCALCTEPGRFVRDLLSDVATTGSARHRLLPGVEVDVRAHMTGRASLLEARWPALFQARNQSGAELDRLLVGAMVTGATAEIVHLTYGTGERDDWPVTYHDGRWQIDYDRLPPDSPLRLDGSEIGRWKDRRTLIAAAFERWNPTFATTDDGAGVRVAHRAIGAHFDPRDGSVLAIIADLDRLLCGVYRIDPIARVVVDRIPVPPPDPRTGIPLGSWFNRWPSAISTDGDQLAFTMPSRLITVDLSRRKVLAELPLAAIADLSYSDDDPPVLHLHRQPRGEARIANANALPDGDSWSVNTQLTAAASPAPTGGFVLWSAKDGPLGRFGHGDVHQLHWSRDGDALLSVHRDGTVWWWDVPRLRATSPATAF